MIVSCKNEQNKPGPKIVIFKSARARLSTHHFNQWTNSTDTLHFRGIIHVISTPEKGKLGVIGIHEHNM